MEGLHRLDDEQRGRLLALAEERTVEPGTLIIEEGQRTPGIVLVLSGTVGIEKDHLGGRVPLDDLTGTQLVGEISFLLDSPATAHVIARDEVRISVIDHASLNRLTGEDPALASALFRSFAESLARRLDRRTGDVATLHWSWG
jgi:CRP-like cAMP-binding protein